MDRNVASDRARYDVIKERYAEHMRIAGKTTDMLDDMGFLLAVCEEYMPPAPIQQPVTTIVETPVQPPGDIQQGVTHRQRGEGGRVIEGTPIREEMPHPGDVDRPRGAAGRFTKLR